MSTVCCTLTVSGVSLVHPCTTTEMLASEHGRHFTMHPKRGGNGHRVVSIRFCSSSAHLRTIFVSRECSHDSAAAARVIQIRYEIIRTTRLSAGVASTWRSSSRRSTRSRHPRCVMSAPSTYQVPVSVECFQSTLLGALFFTSMARQHPKCVCHPLQGTQMPFLVPFNSPSSGRFVSHKG